MLRALLFVTLTAAAACHSAHTDPIVDPGTPPLPPSSGTAIGILLDDATKLALRDDQITKLRAIDSDLATREEQLSARERPPSTAPNPQAPGPQHKGYRAAGEKRRHQVASGGAPDPDKSKSERTQTERDAIARALEVLDPGQRETARKLLDEHGYLTSAPAASAQPTEQPGDPDDPDDGTMPAPEP